MPISFDRVLGETFWAVFFWNHILNLGLGAGLGWAGWRGWAKTLVGSLRAFPRLLETPPEGLSAKKPNWRRLCLDEAKKDTVQHAHFDTCHSQLC